MNWTPDMCDTLKRGVIEGLSYSQIGRALGVSRNAAIGKAYRMGIADLAPQTKWQGGNPRSMARTDQKPVRKRVKKVAAPSRPAKPSKPPQAISKPDSLFLPLEQIGHGQCKWPVNEAEPGEEHKFCGVPHGREPKEQAYCDYHMAMNISRDPCKHLSMIERRNRARRGKCQSKP